MNISSCFKLVFGLVTALPFVLCAWFFLATKDKTFSHCGITEYKSPTQQLAEGKHSIGGWWSANDYCHQYSDGTYQKDHEYLKEPNK